MGTLSVIERWCNSPQYIYRQLLPVYGVSLCAMRLNVFLILVAFHAKFHNDWFCRCTKLNCWSLLWFVKHESFLADIIFSIKDKLEKRQCFFLIFKNINRSRKCSKLHITLHANTLHSSSQSARLTFTFICCSRQNPNSQRPTFYVFENNILCKVSWK